MKSFLEYINEDHSIDGFQGAGLSSTHIPYDIEDAEVKARVNAILGHVAVSEFLNPHAAIAQMESKEIIFNLSVVCNPRVHVGRKR